MTKISRWLGCAALAALAFGCAERPTRQAATPVPVTPPAAVAPPASLAHLDEPPPAPREFRAAWVATVANIDWPSKKGLTTEQQRAEMITILERAKSLSLNAIVLQVRPSTDALYASKLEPWSEYLTGEQGRAPEPYYDPLQVWIDEAHQRGIEIHAWFNPYRARNNKATSREAPSHIANTHPAIVKSYGGYLWLDPGEPVAAQRTLDVILDVVRRYDIDGVHIDDYFYPYPVKGEGPDLELDFPDEPTWRAYVSSGGTLAKPDWRRRNVNQLIERIYEGVHREKRWVRFGVSPFGIGRPDLRPAGIAGFSQYDKLYADVELWMQRCWMDYLVPQVYWPIEQTAQAFPVLLDYWLSRDICGRHVYAGLFTSRINDTPKSWPVSELLNQLSMTRSRAANRGHVHFSMVALTQNRAGVSDALNATHYTSPALIPSLPWLGTAAPVEPTVALRDGMVEMTAAAGNATARFAVWVRERGTWRFAVLANKWCQTPFSAGRCPTPFRLDGTADRVVVSAVDRLGNESARVAVDIPVSLAAVEKSIVAVSQWGGTPADPARAKPHTIKRITLHHAGVPWQADRDPHEYLRSLQTWSREEKRWVDIPYHYVIDLQGRIYEARRIDYAGDTNTEYDPTGHALVEVVGNFEEVQPNPAQLDAVVRVMSWLAKKHGLTEAAIAAHRDFATTDCPGRNLYRYLENGWIRQRVRENLK